MKISKEILDLIPYVPGKPIEETKKEFNLSHVVKLASNENPLGPNPKVLKKIAEVLPEIHRYPDSGAVELTQSAAKFYGLNTNQIAFGNGSNELIDLIIRIFCEPGDKILTSQAAFVAYQICAQVSRVATTHVPLLKDFRIDVDRLIESWTPQHKLIFLPNPNNPTGAYVNSAEFAKILNRFGNSPDVYLVVDEAYTEYVRASDYPNALKSLNDFKNVIILRTMAKAHGMAGLRLGVVLAQPQVIDLIQRIRNPFNVNSLVQAAAIVSFEDVGYVQRVVEVTHRGLDYFYSNLERLKLPYVPSQTNFVFFDTQRNALAVYKKCLEQGVILRPVVNYGFNSHLRMSVGTEEENKLAITALEKALA